MKKSRILFLSLVFAFAFALAAFAAGCSGGSGEEAAGDAQAPAQDEAAAEQAAPAEGDATAAASDAVVVYFSHAGENYGVGVVDEGNTAVVAKMIAEQTGADMFEIVPTEAYPEGYDECCDVALAEQEAGERPTYEGDIDLSSYSTVYLGYPIWWGDLPMVVYTFVEGHDWDGKTVEPFCTHAGSGQAGTVQTLRDACAGATVDEGFSIEGTTAQQDREATEEAVTSWLQQ
ncbi:MAG: flavodoxin [Coriobacteriales bacterium]